MLDPVEFGKSVAIIVREAQAPLLKRIEQLEAAKVAEPAPVDVPALVEQSVRKYFEANPPKSGADGKSVTVADVLPLIADSVKTAIAAIPPPKDGEDGKDAEPIEIADVVNELLSRDEYSTIAKLLAAEAVSQYFAEHPIKNGKDADPGKDGADASDSQVEKAVAAYLKANPPVNGEDGTDGVGLASAMIDRAGNLVLTTTNGATVNLGKVVGDPGKDGADFTNMEFDWDGKRSLIVRGKGGEIVKRTGLPLDAGYWRDGMDCEKGDIVTHNGNAWIAIADNKVKPCLENKEFWRMFARKGRDGNDSAPRPNPGPTQPVKLNGNA